MGKIDGVGKEGSKLLRIVLGGVGFWMYLINID